jgi:preprotein translocase subunit YajC
MKKFKEVRAEISEADKKITVSGITVEIKKSGKEFKAIIDGDTLDTYSSEKEAIQMAKEFIKQYKG